MAQDEDGCTVCISIAWPGKGLQFCHKVRRKDFKFGNFEFLPALRNFSQEKFSLVLRTTFMFQNFELDWGLIGSSPKD